MKTTPCPTLAKLASSLIVYAQTPGVTVAQADVAAGPLLKHMQNIGEIPDDFCHIEWEGCAEFGVLPVFFGDCCTNVHSDGSLTHF